jgi:hypothetical protein
LPTPLSPRMITLSTFLIFRLSSDAPA